MIFKIHASMTYRSIKKNHLVNVDLRVCRLSYVWMTETLRFVRVPRVTFFPFSIIRDPEYSNFRSNVKITVKIDVRTVMKEKIRVKPIGYETFHLADVRITLTKMITHRYA